MERKAQSGYLLLADIAGYTSFVAQTEIEHAGLALSYLLETIVLKMSACLTISKLEGDAVFAYCEEKNIPTGKNLLDVIDVTYRSFRDRAQELFSQSSCPCRACRALPTLDLKFMVHHGEFLIQEMAGIRDLLGTDVNLIHRLMKNHVVESTGWKGYALFTRQGLDHMQTGKERFARQTESYEHLGEVETYVIDMHVRYEEMKTS